MQSADSAEYQAMSEARRAYLQALTAWHDTDPGHVAVRAECATTTVVLLAMALAASQPVGGVSLNE